MSTSVALARAYPWKPVAVSTEGAVWVGDPLRAVRHRLTHVSVCVPAFNEMRLIGKLLAALRREIDAGAPIDEVLVETSGSTDGTEQVVRNASRVWHEFHLLDGPGRYGLAHSLARMFEVAQRDVIVRIDADVTFPPGTISGLLPALNDPKVGIVGPRIVPQPTGHRQLDRLVATEYIWHHHVSLLSPKITNLQVFHRFTEGLPPDIAADDILIQEVATSGGRTAVYDPSQVAYMTPPASVAQLFRQRVRSIRSAWWCARFTGKGGPPTHRPTIVIRAMFNMLRSREANVSMTLRYMGLELAARGYALVQHWLLGGRQLATWPTVRDGTPVGQSGS